MIPIAQVLPLIDRQLKLLEPKEVVQFKTYKKDRGFLIYRVDESQFQMVEFGFNDTSHVGDAAKTKKQAEKALRREFPRSNMVWVTYFQNVDSPFDIGESNSHQGSLF